MKLTMDADYAEAHAVVSSDDMRKINNGGKLPKPATTILTITKEYESRTIVSIHQDKIYLIAEAWSFFGKQEAITTHLTSEEAKELAAALLEAVDLLG